MIKALLNIPRDIRQLRDAVKGMVECMNNCEAE